MPDDDDLEPVGWVCPVCGAGLAPSTRILGIQAVEVPTIGDQQFFLISPQTSRCPCVDPPGAVTVTFTPPAWQFPDTADKDDGSGL